MNEKKCVKRKKKGKLDRPLQGSVRRCIVIKKDYIVVDPQLHLN